MIKKLGKRVLPILLAILMVFSLAPIGAFAAEDEPCITRYDEFILNLYLLEEVANIYVAEVDDTADIYDLIIKYIRTGVDRYNSGSWGIMAGYENVDFANFVAELEGPLSEEIGIELNLLGLKNLKHFDIPNGDIIDFGHMFGTMDITYNNKGSVAHADVGGWAGDIVDLMSAGDLGEVSGTIEEMVAELSENYLCKNLDEIVGANGSFSLTDMYGDLDAYYIMDNLPDEYEYYIFTETVEGYFTEELDDAFRAEYLLKNRLGTTGTREAIRETVYNEYLNNKVVATLEATREFNTKDRISLRKAACYTFADYLCELAGDYVEKSDKSYLTVFDTEYSTLAPGITQELKYATSADGKQMAYYIATADITRDDVNLYANYKDNDPTSWGMQTVLEQANAAQNKYGDPASDSYIENYNVIASTNGAGFNITTGQPGGLLVMGGIEYHPINSNGFFGILDDGTAVIASTEEYNTIYKDRVMEGIAQFGDTLVKDGKIVVKNTTNYYNSRASRTAVGITRTGKVVLMVLDGRQEPVSCGGSMIEIAQIMLEAGCVHAVNLDGGGSSTYVAKQEGEDELSVINRPSDGYARSVSTSLMMVSTAPSSTAFDHAVLENDYDYLTVGSSVQITAVGVSATGNSAELPEGVYWALSDNSKGTITEDGTFTATANGDVDVYLMLGEDTLVSRTLHIVNPDTIGFTKTNLNTVYGAKTELPLKATYKGNPIAINPNDIIFTLSSKNAGSFNGFVFIGNEAAAVGVVKITAALTADANATASITVALYEQGAALFDFDQATGGDEEFAWDRKVSNSTTKDSVIYYSVDTAKDMVTSYIFAIDMSKIEIPEKLSELTYLLPGAGEADASAWGFLCQLAERISVLTEVKPVIRFDKNFDVDYSKITLVNDYFYLADKEFDEGNNTLTLTLKWHDQTEPIDAELANPMCILSGVTLTPKDNAEWDGANQLDIVNAGEIGYTVYMRANALYTFACDETNQSIFDVYPFINPDDASEKGGYFSSVYNEFEDNYTLINSRKTGWDTENGGFVYYLDGVKLTGVKEAEGFYYDFGDNGINAGQSKYTGLFFDEADGVYRYAKLGLLATGWHMIDDDWYYFDAATKAAVTGIFEYNQDLTYELDETGKVVKGCWAKTLYGTRYYYGPGCHQNGWKTIDGKEYYFEYSYRLENGYEMLRENLIPTWYYFDENGACDKSVVVPDGFHTDRNGYAYCKDGIGRTGLELIDGVYYYFNYKGYAQTGTNAGRIFGEDYKAYTGIIEKDGILYYYENGRTGPYGLTKYNDNYYYVYWGGVIKTGKQYVSTTNCDLPKGNYYFKEDGTLANGPVMMDGTLCYFVDGKTVTPGLYCYEGDYYYAYWGGVIKTGKQYVSTTYCDLPSAREYEFGADGKMLNGIVEKNGTLYYYKNGITGTHGLVEWNGDYYYVYWGGVVKTGKQYVSISYCDIPAGKEYEFGADGKMLNGIVEKNGTLYYYNNGITGTHGLVEWNGNYYYVYWGGVVKTGKQYVSISYCDIPAGKEYEFGADGKMLNGIVEKNGTLYYYNNGITGTHGLVEWNDDYYYVYWGGVVKTGKQYVSTSYCDLPAGMEYEFGADGKMLNGFVTKADGIYYYKNGRTPLPGLAYIDGYYYFIYWGGKIITDQTFYVWEGNGLSIEMNYTFDEYGRVIL